MYYITSDGRRHAFPHEKVFFTWYSNFATVIIINSDAMASHPLGKNVTYRPGVKMVKFQTSPRTYVVSRAGVLRWVTNEGTARDLYGTNWNRNVDDISDAFFSDYTFGGDVNRSQDYNVSAEMAAAPTIEQNF